VIELNRADSNRGGTKKSGSSTFTVAVAGKGGTGKTTVAGLLVNELVGRELGSVLAIDADPNANLDELLGFDVDGTIGQLEADLLRDSDQVPPGMTKKRWMELNLQQILAEGKGKDLLVMGRGEGPSCYCAVNNILREYLTNLSRNYDYMVMDNEAGLEHLSRRTTRGIDVLLVISDGNPVALKSARRIAGLVKELEIDVGEKYLVLNRLIGDLPEKSVKQVDQMDIELLGEIPRDEEIRELCWKGEPIDKLPSDSPAATAVSKIVSEFVPNPVKTSKVRSD
jgi:CO dehydrogenase maturation factor